MKKFLVILSLIFVLTLAFSLTVLATGTSNTDAQQSNLITVNFDSDGGSSVDAQKVLTGSKLVLPEAPTKSGYDFVGWYVRLNEDSERKEAEQLAKEEGKELDEQALVTVDGDDEPWSFIGYVVTEEITLTAKWVPNDEMPPMNVRIDGKAFLNSLGLMGKGMVGIFVVTLVIVGVVAILNWHGQSLDNRKSKKQ